mmetsp:Transcript_77970/g.252946  ORF Transcript_77970/g.252946 Transcript_77970/m.252946 type:complete len:1172 (-) Transcript_77970:347-3862(-)
MAGRILGVRVVAVLAVFQRLSVVVASEAEDTYELLHEDSWCLEAPLLDFGNGGVNPTVLSDVECQAVCTNDPSCGVYMFGYQPSAACFRCATYPKCTEGGWYSDGDVNVYTRIRAVPDTPAWIGNCFVLLAEPMEVAPFPDDAVARMRRYFLDNLNINGTGRMTASPGAVPALRGCCAGGYNWDWVRDGALSLSTLLDLEGWAVSTVGAEAPVTHAVVKQILEAYTNWVSELQRMGGNQTAPDGTLSIAFGEPKWSIADGTPYPGTWCRPQTDGPPLRALTLMKFAGSGLITEAMEKHLWTLITFDLDWLANGTGIAMESCDLWEESRDANHFWNRVVMRAALEQGSRTASQMGDNERALRYQRAWQEFIGDPIQDHMEATADGNFITECPLSDSKEQSADCIKYEKTIDGAVILALVHSGVLGVVKDGAGVAVSDVVATTVLVYNEAFCNLYPVNEQDTSAGVPGVLYGRYLKDEYGGGNPWQLISAALANLMYLASQEISRGAAMGEAQHSAWRRALQSKSFRGTAPEFIAAGDSVLARLRHHVTSFDDWHLYEQINRYTGEQYNAKDLTWSYAEVLSALKAREDAVALSKANPPKADQSAATPQGDFAGSCFVTIPGPLADPPFSDSAIAKMRGYFMANLNIDVSGTMMAARGAVPALHDCCEGGYSYDWVRDGALSMLALQALQNSEVGTVGWTHQVTPDVVREKMTAYIGWVKHVQGLHNTSFSHYDGDKMVTALIDSHLEPKWNISTGKPYIYNWCRKQSNGPPLRAQALMVFANDAVDEAVKRELWELIKFDLDWLASGDAISADTCDLWEETTDQSFLWNRIVMRSALLQGYNFAVSMGDSDRAAVYLAAVRNKLDDVLSDHLQFNASALGSFITECPVFGGGAGCEQYGKDIDGAVILALIHRWRSGGGVGGQSGDPLHDPTSAVVARTVQVYNAAFCQEYPINREDARGGVPGILYGRYLKDSYGGGNPWQLITAALASLLYQAAQFTVASGSGPVDATLIAWQNTFGPYFRGEARDFVAAGDAVLMRIRHHIGFFDDWHLFEQIDRNTGKQYNAEDLTWSYAEVLSALRERAAAVEMGATEVDTRSLFGSMPWLDWMEAHHIYFFAVGLSIGVVAFVTYQTITAFQNSSREHRKGKRQRKYGCLNRAKEEPSTFVRLVNP